MTVSHPNLTPDLIARIAMRWQEGWPVGRIANAIKGISYAAVREICAATGHRPEDLAYKRGGLSPKWTRQEMATIRQMLADGAKYVDIAKRLRRSVDAIKKRAGALRAHEECARRAAAQPQPRARQRKCLKCQQLFDSAGPHNRICDSCKRDGVYSSFAVYTTGIGRR